MVLDAERYAEYAHSPDNAWELVEKPILEYFFSRFYRTSYNGLDEKQKIMTRFGFGISKDFRALDLGTGTGRVASTLIGFGVPPDQITGIDVNEELLNDPHYPEGVKKINGDVREVHKLLGGEERFDFIVSNTLFHLLSYEDYVASLKGARKHIKQHYTQVLITVPHPMRSVIPTIGHYHSQSTLLETAPWGEEIELHQKTLQDYSRGLFEAGFATSRIRTYGVGYDTVNSNRLVRDESVWRAIDSKDFEKPESLRFWLQAYPKGDYQIENQH